MRDDDEEPLPFFGKEQPMAREENDLDKIKKLIEVMKENDLLEVEIKHGDHKILLKRSEGPVVQHVTAAAVVPASAPSAAASQVGPEASEGEQPSEQAGAAEELVEIKSPIVGTFYAQPSPDSEPYVEPGSDVEPQSVVCIVEAMKVMNEIKAEVSGTIVEVAVESGQAVEYGQVLFKVKPE